MKKTGICMFLALALTALGGAGAMPQEAASRLSIAFDGGNVSKKKGLRLVLPKHLKDVEAGGITAKRPVAHWAYFAFDVDDTTLFGGTMKHPFKVTVSIRCFDLGSGTAHLGYESVTGMKSAGYIHFKNSGKWMTKKFTIEDASFSNGLRYGADFVVSGDMICSGVELEYLPEDAEWTHKRASSLHKTCNELFARPSTRSNPLVRFQPYDRPHRFMNMGSGLLLYTLQPKTRVPIAICIIGFLKTDRNDLRGQDLNRNGFGRHKLEYFLLKDGELMENLRLDGKSKDEIVVRDESDGLSVALKTLLTTKSDYKLLGGLMKLPAKYWDGGEWKVGGKSGKLTKEKYERIPGGVSSLRFTTSDGACEIKIETREQLKGVLINRYNCLFDNYEVYLLSEGASGPNPAAKSYPASFESRIDMKLTVTGSITDPVRRGTLSPADSRWSVGKLPSVIADKFFEWRFDDSWIDKNLKYQIMDESSEFHGMFNPPDKGSLADFIGRVPVITRDLAAKLAAAYHNPKSKYHGDAKLAEHISAALDYLSATANPQIRQWGDIRLKCWANKPFSWNLLPMGQAIVALAENKAVPPEKIAYWLNAYEYLWREGDLKASRNLRKDHSAGFNAASKVLGALKGALFLEKSDALITLRKSMLRTVIPNADLVMGMRRDGSLREHSPNFFDTGYLFALLKCAAEWRELIRGAGLKETPKFAKALDDILTTSYWLYDNGMPVNITSDARSRLAAGDRYPFWLTFEDHPESKIIYDQITKRRTSALAAERRELPPGFRWFPNPKVLVVRNDSYYFAGAAKPRIITSEAHSWNFNAKIPMGGFYLRFMGREREAAVPTDNAYFSGATLVEGMEEPGDYEDEFMNNAESKFSEFVSLGDAGVFAMDAAEAPKSAPKEIFRFRKTYFFLDSAIIAVRTAPPQSLSNKVHAYPLVFNVRGNKTISVDGKPYNIDKDNQKLKLIQLDRPREIETDTIKMSFLKLGGKAELIDFGTKKVRMEGMGQWSSAAKAKLGAVSLEIPQGKPECDIIIYSAKNSKKVEQLLNDIKTGKIKILAEQDIHAVASAGKIMFANYSESEKQVGFAAVSGKCVGVIECDGRKVQSVIKAVTPCEVALNSTGFEAKGARVLEESGPGKIAFTKGKISITARPKVILYQSPEDLKYFKYRGRKFQTRDLLDKKRVAYQADMTLNGGDNKQ